MQDLRGKTAFITGGASGIGFALAEVFGHQGMNIMLADIDAAALAEAQAALTAKQVKVASVVADVTSRDSVRAAALATIAAFGRVHLVCNNAGVGSGGEFGSIPEGDWDWVVDVNQKAVVYGMEVFVPLIASHGEGGHIVNTASMAGMLAAPGMEPYCATKFAVVAMSEGWAMQLAPKNIGVSILCPGFVQTRIYESGRNRQPQYGAPTAPDMSNFAVQAVLNGIPTAPLAARVLEGVLANELYIFTHVEFRAVVEMRFAAILAAFDRAALSPALAGLAAREVVLSPVMTVGEP